MTDATLPRIVHRIAVLLAAGLSPATAWRQVAAASAEQAGTELVSTEQVRLREVAAHPRLVVDPAGAVGEVAAGDAAWSALSAAWVVATISGAPLAPALRQFADTLRDREAAERDVGVALAGPKATAKVVLWLPAAAVVLAVIIGVDLLATIGHPLGIASMIGGLALILAGRRWTQRLVAEAEPPPPTAGLALDLLAVAAAGGRSPEAAVALVERSLAAAGLDVGDNERCALAALVRLSRQAGAPLGELARAEAQDARADSRAHARQSAERLGVRLMLPLGACILPAFLLLGVVPVLLAIISSTLEG